jgi:hypothetical protein
LRTETLKRETAVALDPATRRASVGVSIQEAVLTAAVVERPHEVLSGEPDGRALVVLEEVELGLGRPDIILLDVDLRAVAVRKAGGMRLRNLTEVRVLGALLTRHPESSGVSPSHFRRLSNRLADVGWLDPRVATRVVADSVLIEAKVTHWGKGVEQLARVRWACHSAALLVPDDVATNIPPVTLSFNGLGLLTQAAGELRWRRKSPRSDLPLHVDAWLGELATRALEA